MPQREPQLSNAAREAPGAADPMLPGAAQAAAAAVLRGLAEELHELRSPDDTDPRDLQIRRSRAGVHVRWTVTGLTFPGEDLYDRIMSALTRPEVAPWLASLELIGREIAGNGIVYWEVERLASAPEPFARLKSLVFRCEPDGNDDDQCGGELLGLGSGDRTALRRMFDRMPALQLLHVPQTPHAAFFDRPAHPLRDLAVRNVDYDDFVANLAVVQCFPHLRSLRLWESFRTDIYPRLRPREYVRLFESETLPALRTVHLNRVDAGVTKKLLRNTRIGRRLTDLKINPAESWNDSPVLGAQPDE